MTFTPKGKTEWYVTRAAKSPRTDEDAAMASQRWGPFTDRDAAQRELVRVTQAELESLRASTLPWPAEFISRAQRVVKLAELGSQHIVVGGLVWRAYPIELH